MTLVPAYGRDYKSKKAIQVDLDAGKDFQIADMSSPYDGKYINLEDMRTAKITRVTVRYGGLRKVAILEVPNGS